MMSNATVKCSAEFRPAGDDQLTAGSYLREFLSRVPLEAVLAPITINKGSQRDPWPVLVGLRATWEEER